MDFFNTLGAGIMGFLNETSVSILFGQDGNPLNLVMIAIACVLFYLAIVKGFEPLLLLPIAFGMLLTNLPAAESSRIFYAEWFV